MQGKPERQLSEWTSLLALDASQIPKIDNSQKIKRTITTERDGTMKSQTAILEAIAEESNNYYSNSTIQFNPKSFPPPSPAILRNFKSISESTISEQESNLVDLKIRPEFVFFKFFIYFNF